MLSSSCSCSCSATKQHPALSHFIHPPPLLFSIKLVIGVLMKLFFWCADKDQKDCSQRKMPCGKTYPQRRVLSRCKGRTTSFPCIQVDKMSKELEMCSVVQSVRNRIRITETLFLRNNPKNQPHLKTGGERVDGVEEHSILQCGGKNAVCG